MGENLIRQGLEKFAMGDLAGATRLWLAARAETPDHPQLLGYLEHIRNVQPEMFAQLEAEALAIAAAERAAEAAALEASDPWGTSETAPAVEVRSSGPGLAVIGGSVQTAGRARPAAIGPMVARLRELMSLDNFTGAIEVAEQILQQDSAHAEAQQAAAHCRGRLATMYLSKLGSLEAVPVVRVPPGEVIWLDLDHRAGFVLAQVDGSSTFEDIIELTGMDRVEAMRILSELLAKRVIAVEPR